MRKAVRRYMICFFVCMSTVITLSCSKETEEANFLGQQMDDQYTDENSLPVFPIEQTKVSLSDFQLNVQGRLWIKENSIYRFKSLEGKDLSSDYSGVVGGWPIYYAAFEVRNNDVLVYLRDIGQPGGQLRTPLGVVRVNSTWRYNPKTGLLTSPIFSISGWRPHSLYIEKVDSKTLIVRAEFGYAHYFDFDNQDQIIETDSLSYCEYTFRLADETDRNKLDEEYPLYSTD